MGGNLAFYRWKIQLEHLSSTVELVQYYSCVCIHCVVIPFMLDVRLVDAPAGVAQEEGHTGYLHLPSAVLALTFIAGRIQPSLSLVEREVEFCVSTNQSFSTCCAWYIFFIFIFGRKSPSSYNIEFDSCQNYNFVFFLP